MSFDIEQHSVALIDEQRRLRPDLSQIVTELVASAPPPGTVASWRAYDAAKGLLSRLVGWDAPPDRYDQESYDLAVSAYIRGAGL